MFLFSNSTKIGNNAIDRINKIRNLPVYKKTPKSFKL